MFDSACYRQVTPLPTMSMSKVTETRTQDDLREAITPLNLGNYLHDLEQHAKQTGQLEDLKINYVLNKKSVQPCYELHRLHAIDCILRVRLPIAAPTRSHLPLASHTSTNH